MYRPSTQKCRPYNRYHSDAPSRPPSGAITDNYEFLLEKRDEFAAEPIMPPPLVTGKDLINLGLKPGPAFKEILEDAQTEQLEGRLCSREQALEWLHERIG